MSSAIAFDTLAYAKKLKTAGFTEAQAEAQAEAIVSLVEERLATKQDMLDLKRDMKEMEASLQRDMKEMETSLQRDMKEMEARSDFRMKEMEARSDFRMKEMETSLRKEIAESKAETVKWMFGVAAGQAMFIIAILKLIP